MVPITNDAGHRPRWTAKGKQARARIVAAAAGLIHERGVAATTLGDIRMTAGVSGSQLSHYFADKDALLQAVVAHQADAIVANQQQVDLSGVDGLGAWRDMIIAQARSTDAKGGCPLGSLGSQLAETDPRARDLVAAGFERWAAAISTELGNLSAAGQLRAGIAPDALATTLLAALQGGLLLAQVQRDTRPLETAVDTLLALVFDQVTSTPDQ